MATSEFPHRICFKFLDSLITEYHSVADVESPQAQTRFQAFIREKMVG
jgi:hypothetical protein